MKKILVWFNNNRIFLKQLKLDELFTRIKKLKIYIYYVPAINVTCTCNLKCSNIKFQVSRTKHMNVNSWLQKRGGSLASILICMYEPKKNDRIKLVFSSQ